MTKGAKRLSLQQFHVSTPGDVPVSSRLPSKSGDSYRDSKVDEIEKKVADISLNSSFGFGRPLQHGYSGQGPDGLSGVDRNSYSSGNGYGSSGGYQYEYVSKYSADQAAAPNGHYNGGPRGEYYGDGRVPVKPAVGNGYGVGSDLVYDGAADGRYAGGAADPGYGRSAGLYNQPNGPGPQGYEPNGYAQHGYSQYGFQVPSPQQQAHGYVAGTGVPPPPPAPPAAYTPVSNGHDASRGGGYPLANGHSIGPHHNGSSSPQQAGPPVDIYSVPPPPPPPRRQQQQQQQQQQPPAPMAYTPGSPDGISVGGFGGVYKPAKAAQLAGSRTDVDAAIKDQGAVAAAKPDAVIPAAQQQEQQQDEALATSPPPQQPEGPKNEWADKMAAAALARMAGKAKSSLLAGDPTAAAVAAAAALAEAKTAAAVEEAEEARLAEERGALFLKPAHPFGRPKLVLMPRTAPPAAGVEQLRVPSPTSPDDASSAGRPKLKLQPRTKPVEPAPTQALDDGRPKLNLQPRSKLSASGSGESASGGKKSSVFGAARPREEVLKERGGSGDLAVAAAAAAGGVDIPARRALGGGSGSRPGSAASGSFNDDADGWSAVGKHRGKYGAAGGGGSSSLRADSLGSGGLLYDVEAFHRPPPPPPRAFNQNIMQHDSGYGYSAGRTLYDAPAGFGGAAVGGFEDESPFFKRALPTRAELF